MPAQLTSDEEEQILQTIDMFEVIAQSNPDDYQSLALLKEAYGKVRRQGDLIRITKLLGAAYQRLGQYAAAVGEFTAASEMAPDDPGISDLLGDAQAMLDIAREIPPPLPEGSVIELDFSSTSGPMGGLVESRLDDKIHQLHTQTIEFENDGQDALAEYLLKNELLPTETVESALTAVRNHNADWNPKMIAGSLLGIILDELAPADGESLLCALLDHTRLGFIPLDHYEVDRQILRMLPEVLTLGRLVVPFDLVSRTLMVAICNPLDAPARKAVQHLLDYNIQWYLAEPSAIYKVLADAFRIKRPKK